MVAAASSTMPVTMKRMSEAMLSSVIPLMIDPITRAPSKADHAVPRRLRFLDEIPIKETLKSDV